MPARLAEHSIEAIPPSGASCRATPAMPLTGPTAPARPRNGPTAYGGDRGKASTTPPRSTNEWKRCYRRHPTLASACRSLTPSQESTRRNCATSHELVKIECCSLFAGMQVSFPPPERICTGVQGKLPSLRTTCLQPSPFAVTKGLVHTYL